MHKLQKKKFFNQNSTPEQEDFENVVFHPEMSEAYAGASSAAAQPKSRKGKFFRVKEEEAKGAKPILSTTHS
ncbi:MAG: hypothetical protein GY861_14175 [bacterium]|nr:hypothetical protein [bacterium]